MYIIKILGILFILFGFSFFGFYYSYKPIYRKNDLLEIKRAILALSSEISFLSSIDEAILNIEKNLDEPIREIFIKFRKNIKEKRGEELFLLWSDAIEKGSKKTYFTKEDKDKLNIIGKTIGNYDRNMNLNGLNLVVEYIDTNIKEIELEKFKNMKMYQSLGVLSGIALVILLI